ncbi:MAG TPA: hypothetical protein V6D17_18895 [Candidatus Obscuribacterales bacterium]
MEFFKKATELADEMLNTVNVVVKKLNAPSPLFRPEDAKGSQAEVTVSIRANGTGEVVAVVGDALRNFPARASHSNREFVRGSRVRIVDAGPNVVYVEASEPDAQTGKTEASSDMHRVCDERSMSSALDAHDDTDGTETAKSANSAQGEESERQPNRRRRRNKKRR